QRSAVVAWLWLIYSYLPISQHQDKKILIIGAALSTLLWIAATLLFRIYVQKFNALNPAYGAIGAIMVLLTWMYYSSFVLLAVGELAAELQAGTGRVDQPAAAEGLSGAGVPRRYALVPTKGQRIPRTLRRPTGNGSHGRWAAFDWIIPSRAIRRTRQTIASAGIWIEDAANHLRTDIAFAVRELGGLGRNVG